MTTFFHIFLNEPAICSLIVIVMLNLKTKSFKNRFLEPNLFANRKASIYRSIALLNMENFHQKFSDIERYPETL